MAPCGSCRTFLPRPAPLFLPGPCSPATWVVAGSSRGASGAGRSCRDRRLRRMNEYLACRWRCAANSHGFSHIVNAAEKEHMLRFNRRAAACGVQNAHVFPMKSRAVRRIRVFSAAKRHCAEKKAGLLFSCADYSSSSSSSSSSASARRLRRRYSQNAARAISSTVQLTG